MRPKVRIIEIQRTKLIPQEDHIAQSPEMRIARQDLCASLIAVA